MTVFYAGLHFLVDGLCALAMFGIFLPGGRGIYPMLIYNFCAFALQMPMGVLLDALNEKEKGGRKKNFALFAAAGGVVCTVAGLAAGPAVLGTGNALFHVGGGVGTIQEDNEKNWKGRGLGVFVAPGALGLYLGTLAAKQGFQRAGIPGVIAGMLLLGAAAVYVSRKGRKNKGRQECHGSEGPKPAGAGTVRLALCCLAVVFLRSYIGMEVTFSWKNDMTAGLLAVLAIVGGKVAGGFLAARHGAMKTAVFSLVPASLCYFCCTVMPLGLAALFFFNMTMPVTLYQMARRLPAYPGFAFGFLTFALFLGFLPGYFQALPWAPGNVTGGVGCAVSLILMAWGICGTGRKAGGRPI